MLSPEGWLRKAFALQGAKALVARLSSYSHLTATAQVPKPGLQHQAEQSLPQPRWLTDAVLASRMQFMLSILVPCTPHFEQVRPRPPTHAMSASLDHLHSCVCSRLWPCSTWSRLAASARQGVGRKCSL